MTKVLRDGEEKLPGLLSRLFFCWMCPLFYAGNKRDLQEQDLVPTRDTFCSKHLGDRLEASWREEERSAKLECRESSFIRALRKAFLLSYLYPGFLTLLQVGLRTYQPLLLARLLQYWSADSGLTSTDAVRYAALVALVGWLSAFITTHEHLLNNQFGMRLRVATGSLIYRKILRLNHKSLSSLRSGRAVNLLANDLSRFDQTFNFLHYLWVVPVQLLAVLILAWLQAGLAAIVGVVALILIPMPSQGGLSKLAAKLREKTASRTDDRLKIMKEVINGIRVIKMYSWEKPFEEVVDAARTTELSAVRKSSYIRGVFVGFMMFTERTALFFAVLTYSLLGHRVTANVIYPVQQLIQVVQLHVALYVPFALSFGSELLVSLKRVKELLILDEISEQEKSDDVVRYINKPADGVTNNGYTQTEYHNSGIDVPDSRNIDVVVELKEASASWMDSPDVLALKNITFRLPKGKLCAIIGPVGSGKSTLLQLLLKELPTANGSVTVVGSISYASQEPWLFADSIRENILFGLPYDDTKYKNICKACALEKDFLQFPHGDQTLVGERGVSLSGGQRARVNLARACYRDADVYLLDDPLSAVDANVGRQLFEGCITGYLRNSTRILVTHQIHYLKTADLIIVLNEGKIECIGTYEELLSRENEIPSFLQRLPEDEGDSYEGLNLERGFLRRKDAQSPTTDILEQHEIQTMDEEVRASGQLKWGVVQSYFTAGGSSFSLFIVLTLIVLSQAAAAGVDYFLSFWMNEVSANQINFTNSTTESYINESVGTFSTAQYLGIQACVLLACIILTYARMIAFMQMCATASKNLHNRMFSALLRAIMRFFDASDSGRILNRFSKDIGAMDEVLPRTLTDVIQIYGGLVCIIILNAVSLYWTLVPSALLLIIFAFIVKMYIKTSQDIKRLEGTTKSPVFGIVSSTMQGIATIRSSKSQKRLIESFDKCQDQHTSAWNCFLGGGQSLDFYIDTLCVLYLILVMATLLYVNLDAIIPVGSVGLALTQCLMLTTMLQHGTRNLVESLGQFTSVERVLEYTRIPQETNLCEGTSRTTPNWPTKGKIVFENVSMRYADDGPPVLKNVNFIIENGWKVGIVGRTGAGKSSLISALFRFADIEGNITIDDLDTKVLSRQELRSKISIIPQEPVLFSATVRYNLDPFNSFSDEEIWRALELVDLKAAVPTLDFKVTEGGSNFSMGQRQLVCLARAVLRSNKILIMDEATANVDPQTDALIQQTIRSQFATCTVLTIAHRLNTIMDSDRVLVMATGEAVEFDHPYILLSDPNSHLSSMVAETGDAMARQLRDIARESMLKTKLISNKL